MSSILENEAPRGVVAFDFPRLSAQLRALPETVPTIAVLAMAALAIGLDGPVGLKFLDPDYALVAPLLFTAAFYALCARTALRAVGEIAYYISLYWTFSLSAVRPTYIAYAANLPRHDAEFVRLDRRLGLDWMAWRAFLHAHPRLLGLLDHAYKSHVWQAPLAIILLAIFVPRRGNAYLLTALGFASIATAAIFALLPATGPAEAFGVAFPTAHIFAALRGDHSAPLALGGIVAFPSFHTVMAICFTFCYRRLKLLMFPALALNLTMLTAVPFSGNHYFVDVIGGAVVAAAALWLADKACAPGALPSSQAAQASAAEESRSDGAVAYG